MGAAEKRLRPFSGNLMTKKPSLGRVAVSASHTDSHTIEEENNRTQDQQNMLILLYFWPDLHVSVFTAMPFYLRFPPERAFSCR